MYSIEIMDNIQNDNLPNGHSGQQYEQAAAPESTFGATGPRAQDQPTNQTLTMRQGHPLTHNQNVRTIGNRGPTTLENYPFLEKISHFDRERRRSTSSGTIA
nr:hypothetical protein A6C57_17195 [Fibrella sp. ES10-3-2-2]